MSDLKIYRWAGSCGLAAVILGLVELPIYLARGRIPPLPDSIEFSGFIAKHTGNILTVVLLDLFNRLWFSDFPGRLSLSDPAVATGV